MAIWTDSSGKLFDDMGGRALTLPSWPAGLTEYTGTYPPAPTLAEAQTAQTTVLMGACSAAITGGFSAAALGGAYTYPSAATDQANLAQTAAAASGGLLMCESAAGVWALVAHTQAQAQAVLADFVAFRDKQRQQLATLTNTVNSATTVAAVQAVAWP